MASPFRMNWTEEEVASLKIGVEKYGVGNWAPILQDKEIGPLLVGRTNVNIKDKWRWLEQHGLTDDNASIKRPKVGKRKITDEGHPKKRVRTEKEVYCICRKPETPGRMMVGCDTCSEWFHPVCVGLSDKEARELKSFKCPLCKEKKKAEKVAPQKQSTVVKKEGNQEGTMKNVVMKRKKDTQVRKEAVHTPVNTKDQEHKPKTKDVAKPVRVIGRAKRASLTVNDPKVKFAVKALLEVLREDNDEAMDLDIGFKPLGLNGLFLPEAFKLDLEGLDLLVHAAALDVADAVELANSHGKHAEPSKALRELSNWGFSQEDQEKADMHPSPPERTVASQRPSKPRPSALARVVQRAKKKMELVSTSPLSMERGAELTVSTSPLSLRPDAERRTSPKVEEISSQPQVEKMSASPPQVEVSEVIVEAAMTQERVERTPAPPRSAQGAPTSEANAFYHFVENSSPARVIDPAFSTRLGNTVA